MFVQWTCAERTRKEWEIENKSGRKCEAITTSSFFWREMEVCVCVLTCVGFWTPTTSVFLDPVRYVRNKRKEGEKGIDTSVFRSTAETAATHVMCVCPLSTALCVSLLSKPLRLSISWFSFFGFRDRFWQGFPSLSPLSLPLYIKYAAKVCVLGMSSPTHCTETDKKITKPLVIYLRSRTAITCRYIVVRDVAIFTNRPCSKDAVNRQIQSLAEPQKCRFWVETLFRE